VRPQSSKRKNRIRVHPCSSAAHYPHAAITEGQGRLSLARLKADVAEGLIGVFALTHFITYSRNKSSSAIASASVSARLILCS